jgi:hypothetical protein
MSYQTTTPRLVGTRPILCATFLAMATSRIEEYTVKTNTLGFGFSCICTMEHRLGKRFTDPSCDIAPIARARLAEHPRGRVPRAVASFQ